MITWLNGTFGAGKTTVGAELAPLVPRARIFDAEQVGYMLQRVLAEPVPDFQDWPPWRALVVRTAAELLEYTGGMLVVPQTVLVPEYWSEIRTGLEDAGIPLRHVVLDAPRDVLVRRIESDMVDTAARRWRLDHLDAYAAARDWLRRDGEFVDTVDVAPRDIARRIAAGSRLVARAGSVIA